MIIELLKRTNRTTPYPRTAAAVLALMLTVAAGAAPGKASADRNPIPAQESALRTVLWMRTAAEYEALARQVYRAAWLQVRSETMKRIARPKPLAVILDLDETVLDNTAYSAYLIQSGLKHSKRRWQDWNRENTDKIGLVPGAKAFINSMKDANVHVAFVSNRSEEIRGVTVQILVTLGLGEKDELLDRDTLRLLLRTGSGSKQARRRAVMEKYDVIALLGDNLGDFSDDFRSPAVNSIEERREKVQEHDNNWATKWFVLPNPIYGYWTRLVDWNRPGRYFDAPRR